MEVMPLVWGTNGKWAAQRAPCGRVEAKHGRKTKICLLVALEKATWVAMRCTSLGCMGLMARSLFSCRVGAGKGGFELPHGPGHAVPGSA